MLFERICRKNGIRQLLTKPYSPTTIGKVERWHGTLKRDCLRPNVPLSIADARQLVAGFVEHYNQVRLHSAIGYVAPADKLAGREPTIFAARDQKLAAARERRARRRSEQTAPSASAPGTQRKASRGPGDGNESPGRPSQNQTINNTPAEGETRSTLTLVPR